MTITAAQEMVPLEEYQKARHHIFRSDTSLRWFLRQHRDALIGAGALVVVTKRYLIVPSTMDAFVLAAGKATAARLVA